jgi:hypothetical protein
MKTGICTFLSYLAEFFLEREKFQTKVVQKIKTDILYSVNSFQKSYRLWGNVEKQGKTRWTADENIIQRMRSACWITKATNTHSEHVTLIAIPLQQWQHEGLSILRYTYIACLVVLYVCLSHNLRYLGIYSSRFSRDSPGLMGFK